MKTKMILLAALLGTVALSANAGVRFGVSIGFPPPVVVSTPVVYAAPAGPAPVTVLQTVPARPGVDYVWAPGYWSYRATGWVWVAGNWQHRPAQVVYGHDRDGHGHGGYRR